MDLQDRENTTLPLLEQQLREAEAGNQNLLNAIQQGILTKSTKARLEELEASKEDLENRIVNEKLKKPRVPAEFITFWLERFRKLDVTKREHRQMLIDSFINAIYLYDDKLVVTFNYKDGTKTTTWDDAKEAVEKAENVSDLNCIGAPRPKPLRFWAFLFFRAKGRPGSGARRRLRARPQKRRKKRREGALVYR